MVSSGSAPPPLVHPATTSTAATRAGRAVLDIRAPAGTPTAYPHLFGDAPLR
ncbi:hypothetical protein [Streptomyces sp. NPDC001770]